MSSEARLEKLEAARDWSLSGRYDEAISVANELLEIQKNDLEALRLKGNILDLKVLELAQISARKLLRFQEFLEAQKCYEKILAMDSENTLALVDLGDHFKNLEAYEKAESFYREAVHLLKQGVFRLSLEDEINDVFDSMVDMFIAAGKEAFVEAAREEQASMLLRE